MGIWTKQGSKNAADIYLSNKSQNSKLYLGLLTNNPDDSILNDLLLTDLTEPSAGSYAREEIIPSNWVVVDELSVYPEIEFEIGLEAYGTVYGVFIATSPDNSGKLLALHKFATPVEMEYYGDRLEVTLRVTIT